MTFENKNKNPWTKLWKINLPKIWHV